jgi:hypothetical protein
MPTPIGYPLNPLKSVQDYTDQYDQAALRQQQIQSNALSFQDRQRALAESQALRNALSSGVDPRTPEGQQKLMTVAPNAAGPVIKSLTDAANVQSQTLLHGAQTNESTARTAKTNLEQQIAKANKAISDIAALSSPDEAVKGINDQVKSGALDMQKATALLQSIPQDPAQFGQWQRKMLLGILDAKDRLAATKPTVAWEKTGGALVPTQTNPDAGAIGPVSGVAPIPMTQSPDSKATVGLGYARLAEEKRKNQESEGGMQYIQTDQGLVAVPKKPTGDISARVVTGPNDKPLGKPNSLKDAPQTVVKAYTANQSALNQIDDAIAAVKSNPDAFGLKNFAGDTIMQRVDEKGVGPRAKVADIGSLKIHDRTGAAMSAAESVRLKPFIPSATDTAETAVKKLQGLKQAYEENNVGMEQYYNEDLGFKPITTIKTKKVEASGVPPDIADILKKHGKK